MKFYIKNDKVTRDNVREMFERTIFHPTKNPLDWCSEIVCNEKTYNILMEKLYEANLLPSGMNQVFIYPASATKIIIE